MKKKKEEREDERNYAQPRFLALRAHIVCAHAHARVCKSRHSAEFHSGEENSHSCRGRKRKCTFSHYPERLNLVKEEREREEVRNLDDALHITSSSSFPLFSQVHICIKIQFLHHSSLSPPSLCNRTCV